MELLTPGTGLILWQLLAFLGLVLVLGRYAWRPILSSLRERERFISDSLSEAESAKKAVSDLAAKQKSMEMAAHKKRDEIVREAKSMAESLKAEAREAARSEVARMQKEAALRIEKEKEAAKEALRKEVAQLSVAVAEKILRERLRVEDTQKKLIQRYLKELEIS